MEQFFIPLNGTQTRCTSYSFENVNPCHGLIYLLFYDGKKYTYGMCWMCWDGKKFVFARKRALNHDKIQPLLAKSQTFGRTPCLRRFRKRMLQNQNVTFVLTKNILTKLVQNELFGIKSEISDIIVWNRQITKLIGKKKDFSKIEIFLTNIGAILMKNIGRTKITMDFYSDIFIFIWCFVKCISAWFCEEKLALTKQHKNPIIHRC